MKRFRSFHVLIVVTIMVTVLVSTPALNRIERLDIDILHWLRAKITFGERQPFSSEVVLIAIDEDTYKMPHFKDVPTAMWTPQLAQVIDSVLDSGAKVVGWDFVLPLAVSTKIADRKFDQALYRSLARSRRDGRIVLGKAYGDNAIRPHRLFNFAVGGSKNIRTLNLHTDLDGIVRGVPLFFSDVKGGKVERQPGFALELAARAVGFKPVISDTETKLGEYSIPGASENVLTLNFANQPGAIPIYSFGDLFKCAEQGKASYFSQNFSGKVIIIGAVLDLEDRRLASNRFIVSPDKLGAPEPCVVKSHGLVGIARSATPGALIHATAINNILLRSAIDVMARFPGLLCVFFFTFLVGGTTLRLQPYRASIVSLSVGFLWTGVTILVFRSGLLLPLLDVLVGGFLGFAGMLGYRLVVSDRERNRITKSFSLYLSPAVIERLRITEKLPELGGESRNLTVLFSDIQGFTEISEKLSPIALVSFLNNYLAIMTDTIEAHGGFVDKYIGDAVVAVFGAPIEDDNHGLSAVRAALECRERLKAEAASIGLPNDKPVETRIGLNTGEMLVGNIGSSRRFNYTVMGDAVNLASRLEGANKQYGSMILVSDSTAALCDNLLRFRELDTIRVVGREEPVTIYEPLCEIDVDLEESKDTKHLLLLMDLYARALEAYRGGKFKAAYEQFIAIEDDPVAKSAASRALKLINVPPPEPWDGITNLDQK